MDLNSIIIIMIIFLLVAIVSGIHNNPKNLEMIRVT